MPDRDPIQTYNIWKYVFGHECRQGLHRLLSFALLGEGTLKSTDDSSGIFYNAPRVKPADPIARVLVEINILIRDPTPGEVSDVPEKIRKPDKDRRPRL
jgi:hypothetical protein